MQLTPLQEQIVNLLMQDLTSKEVAVKLDVQSTNISTCLQHLRKNLKVNTTHGLLLKIQEIRNVNKEQI